MEAFTKLTALVGPLDRANVDTDAIIPKQFLTSIERTGYGDNLFDPWRYLDTGYPGQDCSQRPVNPKFFLNQNRFKGAKILLARRNFGCGSSREHAPWALLDYGFRALIAPSYADIFYNNCFKNGILPVVLSEEQVDALFRLVEERPGLEITIDLETQTVSVPDGPSYHFEVDAFRKRNLLEGLDDIGLTLQHAEEIRGYEARRREQAPWLFGG
ncbi:MAG: 3-isopropylmalate dehydratase small subunit [Ectothiorhodospiraceae bacterium]|nr:3-isopropylmalate dehydratase small subunit [Chromatiales bacterium]MCP5156829.1 3-isopropylmalate dehydratase small subunit [Ectothiorhodospiraceae bacterium]